MRDRILNAVLSKVPEGTMLPWWAIAVKALLHPIEFFYWRMSKNTGYQWQNDTWIINGVTYSRQALRWLANANGEIYRVVRTGDVVTMESLNINALLQRLERYSAYVDEVGGVDYEKDDAGMWVDYDDVEKLLRELSGDKPT